MVSSLPGRLFGRDEVFAAWHGFDGGDGMGMAGVVGFARHSFPLGFCCLVTQVLAWMSSEQMCLLSRDLFRGYRR